MNAKTEKIVIICTACLVILICVGMLAFLFKLLNKSEDEIYENYIIQKTRYELFQEVYNTTIIEGEGINIENINSEKIEYSIRTTPEKVVYKYYLQDNVNLSYNTVQIILDRDYNILDEKWNVSYEEDFEKYKEELTQGRPILIAILIIPILIALTHIVYFAFKYIKKIENMEE